MLAAASDRDTVVQLLESASDLIDSAWLISVSVSRVVLHADQLILRVIFGLVGGQASGWMPTLWAA